MHKRFSTEEKANRKVRAGYAWLLGLGVVLLALAVPGSTRAAENVLTRYPTLHGDSIVFEAGGNLWRVDRQGGTAQRLTTDGGFDIMPRFSPDGKLIAFTGQYDGNTDVYVIPAEGGTATRLTFHSDVVEDAPLRWGPDNMVVTWTPDSKNVLMLSRRDTFNSWFGRLFLVPANGGLPTQLPVPKGGMTSYSPDGTKIAYNRIFRNFRTWKSYRGGLAQDIWIYDFKTHKAERVTTWKGTDTDPMWYHNTIYFASDRGPEKRLNIWAYDLDGKSFRQLTHFKDYDVDWPSLGDSGIVFQDGGSLYVIDLPSEKLHKLEVTVPTDGVRTRPRWASAAKTIHSMELSPNGKRALFGARGDVFTVPAKHGNTRDLTRTSNAREMYPAWSPDGAWVAYATDRRGQAQIAIRPADGSGAETILTDRKAGYLYGPVWSPDSTRVAFSDSDHVLWILTIKDRKLVRVDQDKHEEVHHFSWSPDGLWLAYSKAGTEDMGSDDDASTYMGRIYLYSVKDGRSTVVSGTMSNDYDPVFSPDGKYLYFASDRHPNPVWSQSEFNVATLKMAGVYVATLRKDEASPFAPRSDEGAPEAAKVKEQETWKPGAIAPIRIDLDGLMQRVVPLPIPSGNIDELAAAEGRVYYRTVPIRTMAKPLAGEQPQLHVFEMKDRKDHVLAEPVDAYVLSADGNSVLYAHKKTYTIAESRPDKNPARRKAETHELDLSGMRVQIDPVQEWKEMFHEAWRLERDFFFNPKMNGVDWDAVRTKYEKLLPKMACREDLNYLIGEAIGELHNSHTYVGGGDRFKTPDVPTGLLGVDFALDRSSGRYYFQKIYAGDNSREELRSPLTEPGVDVKQGDFLLAVDGRELEAPTNPYSLFVSTLHRTVTLTVADDAKGTNRRQVTVKPIGDELNLRLAAWIDHNRDLVSKASGGKIGYLYLSDMEDVGMEQFISQFYPQTQKQGLIVDVRWNGGGEIDQIVLERLRRVLVGMATNRERQRFKIPEQVMHGYMVCLDNHYSASDGDIFPYYFKHYGLGPVIGLRTWGGVRGIRGYWPLLDGGYITIPEDSLYGLHSQWVIENHGVDPDIEVDNLPGDVMAGKDVQLEKGIQVILDKLKAHPMELPPPPPLLPAYPPEGQP
ncbi:MAG: PDZ domain-containing protein [Acidobacteria bacterium]|nr:PDZ domain-containing protein [Acidobacteriota bacterium]